MGRGAPADGAAFAIGHGERAHAVDRCCSGVVEGDEKVEPALLVLCERPVRALTALQATQLSVQRTGVDLFDALIARVEGRREELWIELGVVDQPFLHVVFVQRVVTDLPVDGGDRVSEPVAEELPVVDNVGQQPGEGEVFDHLEPPIFCGGRWVMDVFDILFELHTTRCGDAIQDLHKSSRAFDVSSEDRCVPL